MKTKIFKILVFALVFWAIGSCQKDDPTPEEKGFTLPPETQTGANTFGVTINGKVYIPRDPTGTSYWGDAGHGITFTGNYPQNWYEIIVIDGTSNIGFKIWIHFKNLFGDGVKKYILAQSNFQDNIDSIDNDHIFFKIWDARISNYAYYGSVENQAEINVTKLDNNTGKWILSGNFKGKFVRYDNPNEFIQINDGRFDLNLNTINNHIFP